MPSYQIQREKQRYLAPNFKTLQQWVVSGRVKIDDFIWTQGWNEWIKVYNISGLQEIFQARHQSPTIKITPLIPIPRANKKQRHLKAPPQVSQQQSNTHSSTSFEKNTQNPFNVSSHDTHSTFLGVKIQELSSYISIPFSLKDLLGDEEHYKYLSLRRSGEIETPHRLIKQAFMSQSFEKTFKKEITLLPMDVAHPLNLWTQLMGYFFHLPLIPDVHLSGYDWSSDIYPLQDKIILSFGQKLFYELSLQQQLFMLGRLFGAIYIGSADLRLTATLLTHKKWLKKSTKYSPQDIPITSHFIDYLVQSDSICDMIGLLFTQDLSIATQTLEYIFQHHTEKTEKTTQSNDIMGQLENYITSSVPFAEKRIKTLQKFVKSPIYSNLQEQIASLELFESIRQQIWQLTEKSA